MAETADNGVNADGYTSALDDPEAQEEDYRHLAQQIIDILSEASTEKVQVFYGGGTLTNMEVTQ
eukprot:scaffold164063_cov24-Prasinocladus_malaysianus.AAC.1